MNERYLKKIICVLSCAVLSALFIVLLFFCPPKTQAVNEAEGKVEYIYSQTETDDYVFNETLTAEAGKDFTAVRITDLGRLKKITKVNYVADKFVNPDSLSPDIQIVDLTKPFEFAEKGTLIFVIFNLDPYAEDFREQAERLNEYKIGDSWRFTLSLPEIFCASNVYQKTTLIARHGEIENYDFKNFTTSYDKTTENFSSKIDGTLIDLDFYTKRTSMEDAFNAAKVVTIHYQSTGSAYSGIKDAPLIGTESAVKSINENSKNLLISFAILAAVVFAVLAVLAVLERSYDFVSAIVWILGITVMLLSRFFLRGVTSTPLLWSALSLAASFVILGGALLALGRNFGKVPTKYMLPALSAVGALLAFLCPFIPFGAASIIAVICKVIKGIGAAALSAFIGFALFCKDDKHSVLQTVCTAIIDVAVIASLFMPQVFPAQINPIFWLCAAVTVTSFISVFMVITDMKKSNVYLTANLHSEVERQVKDIKAVIAERDNLLQFVSHDMKKPLASAETLIDMLIDREKDAEQKKGLQIVKSHTGRIISNLSEIAVFAKFNYIAEPSQVIDLSELCENLCEFHHSDCNANGIILKNTAVTPVNAFVKPKGIENVVSNLIINAIEHANCSTVTLSVKTDKNKVVLCVADDGKGIDESLDVFKPYVSENDSETGGVGLYICKNIIESMNGELTYVTGNGTTFYISLLKA